MKTSSSAKIPGWWIAVLLSASYLLAFMQRTGPGVISSRLQSEFHVSGTMLGSMTSIQFVLYMILQIPIGLSGDKFGPEKLLVAGVGLDGAGTLIFAHAHSFWLLLVGRGIVGLGDAFIFVNIVLIIGRRFSSRVFASILGIVSTFGNVGALLTTIPFAAWTANAGWRMPFTVLAAALLFVAALDGATLIRTPSREDMLSQTSTGVHIEKVPVFSTLALVVKERNAWATAMCHMGAVGTYLAFMGLWAVPYFMETYHLSAAAASSFTLIGFVGALVGGVVVGPISDRIGNRRVPYRITQLLTTIAWLLVPVFGGIPPIWLNYAAMFVLGFGSGASLLTFAVIRDQTPAHRSGVMSGFANTGGFLSAVFLPILYGAVVDAMTHGLALHPSPRAFQMAFLVPSAFSLIGFIGSLLIKEELPAPAEG